MRSRCCDRGRGTSCSSTFSSSRETGSASSRRCATTVARCAAKWPSSPTTPFPSTATAAMALGADYFFDKSREFSPSSTWRSSTSSPRRERAPPANRRLTDMAIGARPSNSPVRPHRYASRTLLAQLTTMRITIIGDYRGFRDRVPRRGRAHGRGFAQAEISVVGRDEVDEGRASPSRARWRRHFRAPGRAISSAPRDGSCEPVRPATRGGTACGHAGPRRRARRHSRRLRTRTQGGVGDAVATA